MNKMIISILLALCAGSYVWDNVVDDATYKGNHFYAINVLTKNSLVKFSFS